MISCSRSTRTSTAERPEGCAGDDEVVAARRARREVLRRV